MSTYEGLKSLQAKVAKLKDKIDTEESTKHAFVLPFINILGYDTFDPTEVVPEFTADIGLKKGEKVDYAIFHNDKPILIIECKHWGQNLNVHNSQLFRYFHTTKTRFALLTNGCEFRFYSDLEEPNKMDERPFFEFHIDDIKESTAKEVEKFHKNNFDVDKIVSNASRLKYTKGLRQVIATELDDPSPELVKHFASQVTSSRMTANVVDEFTELLKKAFQQHISSKINERLNTALEKEQEVQKDEEIEEKDPSGIETTQEEIDAYRIVVAIMRKVVPPNRITHRDKIKYFGILLDDNNRKPICRLHLNTANKYISLFDQNREEEKIQIDSIDNIYDYADRLVDTMKVYED